MSNNLKMRREISPQLCFRGLFRGSNACVKIHFRISLKTSIVNVKDSVYLYGLNPENGLNQKLFTVLETYSYYFLDFPELLKRHEMDNLNE